jgi:hypothetical protein
LKAGGGGSGNLTRAPFSPLVTIKGTQQVQAPASWNGVALSGNNAITTFTVDGSAFSVLIDPGQQTNSGIIFQGTTITAGKAVALLAPVDADDDAVMPVAFFSGESRKVDLGLYRANFGNCAVYATECPNLQRISEGLLLSDGKIILEQRGNHTSIRVRELTVELNGSAIAELECSGDSLLITNLNDVASNALQIRTKNGSLFSVQPGHSVAINRTRHDIPTRKERDVTNLFSCPALDSEVSIPYIMSHDALVRSFIHCAPDQLNALLRMIACLQLIQSEHGPYH